MILHKLDVKDDDKNKILILPQIPCHYGVENFPFELTRLQFPSKIAFALTINGAQAQSAQKCGILLSKNVWTHGQMYVASFLLWEPTQHFCMGRAVTFQRLQGKTGAWEEIYQECSVQRSS